MSDTLLYILGIVIVVLGLALSIGLHEFGHLIPAKIFGVKVPHWAIGFGPKLFSKKVGETEYSVRLIPLGGFITMIGMYPPENAKKPDSARPFGKSIAQAREAHSEYFAAGDEKRTLWTRPAWQRIIIMLGGPTVNLILGLLMISIALSGIGGWTQGSKIDGVVACQAQMVDAKSVCSADSAKTPAALAGLQAGDRVVSVDGVAVDTAAPFLAAVTKQPIVSHHVVVTRSGQKVSLVVTAVLGKLPTLDAKGDVVTVLRPYIGLRMGYERHAVSLGESFAYVGTSITQTFGFISKFPEQVWIAVSATVSGQKRATDSAISVVGIGQVAGQVTASKADWLDKLYSNLMLLGSLNLALFAFNMIPVPPLYGGHVAGGVYEYLKRGWYRVRGKKGKVRVDTALMAPFAQGMFVLLLLAGVLMIVVDIVNPITL